MKKILLINVPTPMCNLQCNYCYIPQTGGNKDIKRNVVLKYSPETVAKALSNTKCGGECFINMCGNGETLLCKDIELYIQALLNEGHYIELVSNLTITPVINKILAFDKKLLNHLEFKCSFHFLQLKKHNLLDVFVQNVHNIWAAGASATIEMAPEDALIPYIEEIKEFSMANFGALPQLTVLRNDKDYNRKLLTNLSYNDYINTWKDFNSSLWKYKLEWFNKHIDYNCNAGKKSIYVNLGTGVASACYGRIQLGNIFDNPDKQLPEIPICKCPMKYCYNNHAMLSLGLVPEIKTSTYSTLRNNVNSTYKWLTDDFEKFVSTTVNE